MECAEEQGECGGPVCGAAAERDAAVEGALGVGVQVPRDKCGAGEVAAGEVGEYRQHGFGGERREGCH